MRPVAVITDVTDLDPRPAVRLLTDAGFEVHVLAWDRSHELPEGARRAIAAIAGYARLDEAFLSALPDLEWIGTSSTGTDMVDAAAAAAHGVTVQPLVGASTEEVATHALALILAVERALPAAAATVAAGGWTNEFDGLPRRLSECTLALCGLGRIGTRLAQLARPLFGRIIGHDPYAGAADMVDALVPMDKLLAQADVLSLHLPLTAETVGIIDATALQSMPRGASLVNCSRGELVDEKALIAALETGWLRGAGLDVLVGEPPTWDAPLRTHPRAIITPHMAFLSATSIETYELQPARNLLGWWNQRHRGTAAHSSMRHRHAASDGA